MSLEIERKYLVISDAWRPGQLGVIMRQGYLASGGGVGATVRVRVIGEGRAASGRLTIKGPTRGVPRSVGDAPVRDEYEYEIPGADAAQMIASLCGGRVVEKTRFEREHAGVVWEVDVFSGAHAGLVLAEVELDRPDQRIELPSWAGREVTGDPAYANSTLAETALRVRRD